jgi:hypothetical protein
MVDAPNRSPFLQHQIGRGDGIAAEAKLRGKRPLTGQPVAGAKPAQGNLLLDMPCDLRQQKITLLSHQMQLIRGDLALLLALRCFGRCCGCHGQRPAYQS